VGGVKRSLHLVTAQGRTADHQLWFYLGTSKMETGFSDGNIGKTSYLGVAVCPFFEVCLILFLCDLRVSFTMRHNFEFYDIYIYIYTYSIHVCHISFQITLIGLV
jgi:hypothetical protein